jgi:hypothetical protein
MCTTEDIAALSQQIADLSAQIQTEAAQTRAELGASIAGVSGQVDGVSGQVAGVAAQVDGVSGQVAGVSGQVDGVSGQIADQAGGRTRIRMVEFYDDDVRRRMDVRLACDQPLELLALFYNGPDSAPPGYKLKISGIRGLTGGGGNYTIGTGPIYASDTAGNRHKELLRYVTDRPLGLAAGLSLTVDAVWTSTETENPTITVDQTWTAIVETVEDAECAIGIVSNVPQWRHLQVPAVYYRSRLPGGPDVRPNLLRLPRALRGRVLADC